MYHPHNPRLFQWAAGVELATNYGKSKDIFFLDLFVSSKIGPVEFMAGQRKNTIGLLDSALTSGSLAMAGNARPFPRFQISIPEFLPLGFTNDLIAVKANYSDGRFGKSGILYGSVSSVPVTYFHQKSLYIRIGHTKSKIQLFGGINHQAIWGGEAKILPIYDLKPPKAYWYTITGKTLDYRKIGFHFGTIDLGIKWRKNEWSYFLYRQNIYETGSLFRIINFSDGLNGVKITRNKQSNNQKNNFVINSVLFEVVNTQNQTNHLFLTA
ncbi:capsule assembly Wzi family protein [Dyadobacter sp. LHD-138]|uniref:capsule assembly Wzi family protein n=1 Tax=Dyadobacter sp. LHD-138 TaxID=3071413 RepID=UPI0027DF849B|nr:capsule assembly Wzi family protein [Dyadobacter sp. LHD-138]MDQ6482598.1 capsule assembly Wzi family protein [Dyadobacter sp. LHD-138]